MAKNLTKALVPTGLILCLLGATGYCYLRKQRRKFRDSQMLLLRHGHELTVYGKSMRSQRFDGEMRVWLPGATSAISLSQHFKSSEAELLRAIEEKRERWAATIALGESPGGGGSHGASKFVVEMAELITGEPKESALGVMHFMKIRDTTVHLANMAEGVEGIRAEFDRMLATANEALFEAAASGSEPDKARALCLFESTKEAHECMRYVLDEAAGSSDKLFPNSPFPRGEIERIAFSADLSARASHPLIAPRRSVSSPPIPHILVALAAVPRRLRQERRAARPPTGGWQRAGRTHRHAVG